MRLPFRHVRARSEWHSGCAAAMATYSGTMGSSAQLADEQQRGVIGLDLVRFGSAMAVVLYHLAYFWWPTADPDPRIAVYAEGLAGLRGVARFGWVGVPLFFVISGFVIAFSAHGKTPLAFVRSRILRLYPAAWICATITLLVTGTAQSGAWPAWRNAMLLSPRGPWIDGVYWTLAIELMFYALVALCLIARARVLWLGWALGLASTGQWLAQAVDMLTGLGTSRLFAPLSLIPGSNSLLAYGCTFSLGIALWTLWDRTQWDRTLGDQPRAVRSARGAALALAGVSLLGVLLAMIGLGRSYVNPATASLAQQCAPLALLMLGLMAIVVAIRWNAALRARFARHAPAIRTIGLATYPLYLVHSLVGRAIMLRASSLGAVAGFAIGVAAVLAIAGGVLTLERPIRGALAWVLGKLGLKRTARAAEPAAP